MRFPGHGWSSSLSLPPCSPDLILCEIHEHGSSAACLVMLLISASRTYLMGREADKGMFDLSTLHLRSPWKFIGRLSPHDPSVSRLTEESDVVTERVVNATYAASHDGQVDSSAIFHHPLPDGRKLTMLRKTCVISHTSSTMITRITRRTMSIALDVLVVRVPRVPQSRSLQLIVSCPDPKPLSEVRTDSR